jgi:hypothetical protein
LKTKPKHLNASKRLDGKKISLHLTAVLENDLRQYRTEHRIESEQELIRQAIAKYVGGGYDDDTLKLSGIKDVHSLLSVLRDMVSVLFSYSHMMHLNLLAYNPEIPDELKDAAYASASARHDKFFSGFQNRLKNDPPFFEKLLHNYVAGSSDE